MDQQEFESLMFGPGRCAGCGQTKQLVMVAIPSETVETDEAGEITSGTIDLAAPRSGYCHECALAKFRKTRH